MFRLIQKIINFFDYRPQWVKEEEAGVIQALKDSGDDLYISTRGGLRRKLRTIKQAPFVGNIPREKILEAVKAVAKNKDGGQANAEDKQV